MSEFSPQSAAALRRNGKGRREVPLWVVKPGLKDSRWANQALPSNAQSVSATTSTIVAAALNLYGIFDNLTFDASLDLHAALQLPNGSQYFASDLPTRTDANSMLLPSFTSAAKRLVRGLSVYPVSGTQSSRTAVSRAWRDPT